MDANNKTSKIIQGDSIGHKNIQLTQEEKIDYIFRYVKKQERNVVIKRYIKMFFYLGVLIYFYIMITIVLPRILGGIIPGVDIGNIRDQIMGNSSNSAEASGSRVSEALKHLEGINF